MKRQLYSTNNFVLPRSSLITSTGSHIEHQTIPFFPFMYWPDGRPCEAVNMYFLTIAHRIHGRTLETYASELSPFIRFCFHRTLGFHSLTDGEIFQLSKDLQEERHKYRTEERVRNHNTVRTILGRCITFLFWYQRTLLSASVGHLISEEGAGGQITVVRKTYKLPNRRRTITYFEHRAMPARESREPKTPIASTVIESLEKCVDDLALRGESNPHFSRRFKSNPDMLLSHLHYMRSRRHFLIWMMKRTGLRPAELVEISTEAHEKVLVLKKILIPTMKRRRATAPLRQFPILLNDALVFHRYLIARKKFLTTLRANGKDSKTDALFLGLDGLGIKKSSLERDFSRLAVLAGFQDTQVCLSMFRHRFITLEVIAHITEFMHGTGKTRHLMTHTDYESILKRVAEKTGHGDPMSLWHYIDLAWAEMNVWGGVDKAIERWHAADDLFKQLLELQHELASAPQEVREMLSSIAATLKDILSSTSGHFMVSAQNAP